LMSLKFDFRKISPIFIVARKSLPMRKDLLFIACIIIFFIGFSSCHNDVDVPPGSFTSDGKTFSVSNGYSILESTKDVGVDTYYYWSVYLTSPGIQFSPADKTWKGEGEAVLLFFTVLNDDGFLPPGSYNTDKGDGDCAVYTNFNIETGTGQKFEDMENASFEIRKTGTSFAITFTATLPGGKAINGSYKGLIEKVVY